MSRNHPAKGLRR